MKNKSTLLFSELVYTLRDHRNDTNALFRDIRMMHDEFQFSDWPLIRSQPGFLERKMRTCKHNCPRTFKLIKHVQKKYLNLAWLILQQHSCCARVERTKNQNKTLRLLLRVYVKDHIHGQKKSIAKSGIRRCCPYWLAFDFCFCWTNATSSK